MGYADRTTLNSLTPNMDIGDVADPALRLAAFQYLYNLSDENFAYIQNLVLSGSLSPYPPNEIYRQALINPNFEVAENGTSFTSTGYTLDQWYSEIANSTVTQDSNAPPVGSRYTLKSQMTGSGYAIHYQALEQNACKALAGKNVIISIKVRKNAAFLADLSLNLEKNSTGDTLLGGSWVPINLSPIPTAQIPTGTTDEDWATFTSSAIAIPNDGTANGLRIRIHQTSAQASGAYYEISQAIIQEGSALLAFQPRNVILEKLLCAWFFRKGGYSSTGRWSSGDTAEIFGEFGTPMRIAPTITLNTATPTVIEVGVANKTAVASAIGYYNSSTSGYNVSFNGFSGATSGNQAATSSNPFNFDARL